MQSLRLRLLTLLALYDLLPYSVLHPPDEAEPLDLASVVEEHAFQKCLEAMTAQGTLTVDEAGAFTAVYNGKLSCKPSHSSPSNVQRK
ncbi:hypothetical protein DFP72DRAFT_1009289 [Ephemerocybe angulata]|uniref:Uncharacterized protein n=1 Tax=Ephemerocybe angulata TaxID=980116 RepID=A0A8H6M4S3_9AGAR|nr:hypothetical protein DFP72DRAFT_1009289 [Tulosesus angulatus]